MKVLKWKIYFQKVPSMLHVKEIKAWENVFLHQWFPKPRLSLIRWKINANLKDVTSAKTIWSVRTSLCPQLLTKHVKWEVSYVVLVLMWITWSSNCKLCKEQCVSSAFKINFKTWFRVQKIDVITGEYRCRMAKHLYY